MANLGTHAALLSADFASSLPGLLGSHSAAPETDDNLLANVHRSKSRSGGKIAAVDQISAFH
jgi:hypothetical protein